MKAAEPSTLMDHPEYRAEWDRLQAVKAQLTATDREIADVAARYAQRPTPQDIRRGAAEAMLRGESPPLQAGAAAEEMAELRERARVLREAERIQRQRVDQAAVSASLDILAANAPEVERRAQDLAKKLVAAGEAADAFNALMGQMEDGGIQTSLHYRTLPLDSFLTAQPGTRLNALVDALCDGFGVEVRRALLEATTQRRERDALAFEKRKRESFGSVAAGPRGITRYQPGKPPVHTSAAELDESLDMPRGLMPKPGKWVGA